MSELEIKNKLKDIFLDLCRNYSVYEVQPDEFMVDIISKTKTNFKIVWESFEKSRPKYQPTTTEILEIGVGEEYLQRRYALFLKFIDGSTITDEMYEDTNAEYTKLFKSLNDESIFKNPGEA